MYIDLENQRKYVTLFVIVVIWLAKKGSCLAREPASQLTSSRAELRAKILRANFEPSLLRAKDFRASSEPSFSRAFSSYTSEPSRAEPSLARSHPYLLLLCIFEEFFCFYKILLPENSDSSSMKEYVISLLHGLFTLACNITAFPYRHSVYSISFQVEKSHQLERKGLILA